MIFITNIHHRQLRRGFTLVELVVSMAIFALLTALLVSKYGSFNSSVLLTNHAYDVALTLRNAQTYGLNVKSRPTANSAYTSGQTYADIAAGYQYVYGVHFEPDASGTSAQSHEIIFFADDSDNPSYDSPTQKIASYSLRNGSYISRVCLKITENQPSCVGSSNVDIWFERPEPDAHFSHPQATFAEITIKIPSGETKKVLVRKTGQIVVLQNS